MSLMAGMTRFNSSDNGTSGAPGRVDWPPRSRIVAPEVMWERIASFRVEGERLKCFPPSEKESGVRFRMDMILVSRDGWLALNAGSEGELDCFRARGVRGEMGSSRGGSADRWS